MVDVNVLAGYPTGNISAEQGTITVAGLIDWADVPTKLGELFPAASTSTPGANAFDPLLGIYRCQSVEFRPQTDTPDVIAGGATITSPFDATFELPNYDKAVLTINYASPQVENSNPGSEDQPNGTDDVAGLTHQLSTGGETITLEKDALYWSDGTSANGTTVSAHKIVVTIEHNIQWKRVLSPPWEAMRSLVGKVNDMDLGPFQTGTIVEETLLYLGFTATPDIMADGVRVWDIGFRFSERRVDELTKDTFLGTVTADGVTGHASEYGGWNHFWKQEEATIANTPPGVGTIANPKLSGFRRLHAREPSGAGLVYEEDAAIFKKGALETLFVQV